MIPIAPEFLWLAAVIAWTLWISIWLDERHEQ
jgi:hypothetical protein